MPTYTVNGITWNYYLVGVTPNQKAVIGDGSSNAGNATNPTNALSGTVTIPGTVTNGATNYPVTEIGQWSFVSKNSVTSVIIPDSVTHINFAAFYSMGNLSSVILGNSVISLGDYAFYYCSLLSSINIPDSVTSISNTNVFGVTSSNLVITMSDGKFGKKVPSTDQTFFANTSVDFVLPPQPPTMTITSTTAGVTSGSTTNNTPIALTFTSSASTSDFLAGDISLTNGTLSPLAGSGAVYTATFTPTGQGACTINVAAGVFTAAGQNNTASNTFTWTFDSVSPSMTITSTTAGVTSGSTTNVKPIELTFTSTEATNNFVVGDITVTNGAISNFASSSPTVYTATFTPTGSGPVACTIDVLAGAYTDAATNLNNLATQFAFTYDNVPPTMTITSTTDGVTSGSTTNNETIELIFTSSKPITNFVEGDISLTNGALTNFAGSGAVYTATFTPTGQGACTIVVASDAFTSAAGLNNTAATTFNWTFDSVSPSMTITSTTVTSGSTTNNETIALTFTSTEATTNFVVGDITVTNGAISNFAGSGTVYTATFTPIGQGVCTIGIAAGAYTDAATNLNNLATQFTWTFDSLPPSMTITSTTAGVTSGSTTNNTFIELTFTSTEATNNFGEGDISLTNGAITAFTGSGTVYTATFTPNGQGLCTIDVAAGAYTDAATNLNNLATQFTWTFDSVSPSMIITSTTDGVTSGSTTDDATIALTFTSSEATTNLGVGNITVTNGALTNFAGSGTVYTAIFTPIGQGLCTIGVAAGAYTDAAGNSNIAATTFNWSFEIVDYENATPTPLSFVNNTLVILNRIDSADIDKVSFDVNAGSPLYSLKVTNLLETNSISYVLDISGGSTVSSGSFTQAGVDLLNGNVLEQATDTTYILTLTSGGTNAYSIIGKSLDTGYTVANALSIGFIPNFASINEANKLEQTYIMEFLDVSGEVIQRSGNLTVTDGNLLVNTGDVSFNTGKLYVAGNVSMNSNMMVTGKTILTNTVTLGPLDVSGATTLDSTLTVAGTTTLNNVARIDDNRIFAVGTGATTMGGNVEMNSQLTVAGDVSMNSTVQVVGATSLKNTTVAGILTLNSTTSFLNDISFNGPIIDICGNLYANYPDNSIPVSAIIGFGGNIIDADASMNASLNVSGATSLSSFAVSNNTLIGGTLITTEATTMSSLNTSNNANVGGMLTIAGNAAFLNDVSFIGSRIDICGNLYATYPNSSIPLSALSGGNMTVYNTDVSLNARLNVVGATTLASTLAVTGKTTFSNDISFSGPRIDICGNLHAIYASNSIPQSAIIGGIGSLFTTDVSVNAGLYVQGKITLGSATMQYKESPIVGVYIDPLTSGNIVTSGNSTVGNVLSIAAGTTMTDLVSTDNAAIGGTLIVAGATTSTNLTASSNAIIGALTITGIPTFPIDTSMNSGLVVDGDVSFNSKMMVMTDVSANARLSIGGDVSMNSTMRVAGDTTLRAVTIAGALAATGATTMNSTLTVTGATTISGVWNVAGAMPFTTDVSMNSRLSVGGDVSMNAKLFVVGATTMSQLTASSNGTIGGTMAVTGNSTFAARGTMNSKLTVIGDVSMNARLAVVNNNATTIGSTLGVLGATTLSTLTTTSNAILGTTLAVTGITTFSGDVSLNGTSVDIAGNLTASGYTLGNATLQYKTVTWAQLGNDIDGEGVIDEYGHSVAISSDGSIVAIGAIFNSGTTGNFSGHVRVYQRDAASPIGWRQLGNDIDGEAASDQSGRSVSLSSDGSVVAIGAAGNNDSRGHVRVYQIDLSNTANGWQKVGGDIDGEAFGDRSGWSVSLSGDGKIVAIGAKFNAGTVANSRRGSVQVYEQDLSNSTIAPTGWKKVGADIDGEMTNDESGAAVALSSDGSTVAIGAVGNDGTAISDFNKFGHVRVYKKNISNVWQQAGNDIDGEAMFDESGSSVALSSDGSVVAIGAIYNDGTIANGNDQRGHVRVYQLISNVWTKLGNDIDGEAADDVSGHSVSLSSNGTIVAIGARLNDGTTNDTSDNRGHVRVYQLISNVWQKVGNDIDGEAAGDQSGSSVALSSDGSIVAIGARWNDGTSGTSSGSSGHVRVYKLDTSIPINGLYIDAPMITPNLETTGYATVGGILGVTGATVSNSTLSIVGATTMTSFTAGSNATIGGTLTINGATTLSSTLNITGATTTSALTTSSNATVGGTLNVTGATNLTELNYTDKIMQW